LNSAFYDVLVSRSSQDTLNFYTGISDWCIFDGLFLIRDDLVEGLKHTSLVMFLMKLRLNLFDEDVAFCFGVHRATVSRNFDHVLDILYVKTKHLIHWPDRDVLYATMPTFFMRFS
jgi:hypothetical protein